ncbi:MAG: GNAT family N-acetyltransferase [Legionellaceae bacterium]|nr:GNAT family N-acetyltransferase [Legionellaceae bacterium]
MSHFKHYRFDELTNEMLYEILRLRAEVFIVEQNIAKQDLDKVDLQAQHVVLIDDQTIQAYARVFHLDNNTLCFGRVLTAPEHRDKGLGKLLIRGLMDWLHQDYSGQHLSIESQAYLEKFYQEFGLITQGEPYLLNDLPHVKMTARL